jgi:general secretion pathway protein D
MKTTVMLKDGNTLVIGGLIQDNKDEGVSKAPFIGDIPILGWLFKYKKKTIDKTNLFFFISPRVIRTVADAQALTSKKNAEAAVPEGAVIKMFEPKKSTPKTVSP